MPFTPAIADQRAVLDHVVGVDALSASERFSMADAATIDAVLVGAGDFARDVWAPLNRIGDTVGAQWTPNGVKMPAGYQEAYRQYVEGGWGTLAAPPAFGGQGLPFVLQAAVIEHLGSANLAFTLCPILSSGAIEALTHHGSGDQQARYLPHLATGAWTGTMNLTEPQAGSDVGALRTFATPRDDGLWNLKGSKIFISFGDHDLTDNIVHLVLARTPLAPAGTRGISLFLVPKFRLNDDGTPGAANDVRTVSIEHKLGLHASPTCTLAFGDGDDCVGELIGAEHGGMRAMFTMMNNARLNVGLQGVQVAEAATQAAAAYALGRIQSPRAGSSDRASVAIAEHPDVRRMLLRMKAQTKAIRALVYLAMAQIDRAAIGEAGAAARLDLLTPLAKSHATDIANEVASLGVQVHGGMGFVEETGAAQFLRDARILPIYEGTNGIQAADLVGRKLTADGGRALGDLLAQIKSETRSAQLKALVDECAAIASRLLQADVDDRLAGSSPFLTMVSVAVCGWCMERLGENAVSDGAFDQVQRAACAIYLEQIVPEALGLGAAAGAGAATLYAFDAEALVA